MTDIVKETGGGQVFIPDSLSDTDKEYLQEVSGQITTTIQRAAVRVGFYLLEVKERFRENGAFSGPNGWYGRWFESIGLTKNSALACTNAALLSINNPELADAVELLGANTLRAMSPPTVKGGVSSSLQKKILTAALNGEKVSESTVLDLKRDPNNKLDSLIEAEGSLLAELTRAQDAVKAYDGPRTRQNLEYKRLQGRVKDTKASIIRVKAQIETLLNEQANPTPVVEQPKEEPTPPPEPVVIDPNPELEQELTQLQQEKERILQEYAELKSKTSETADLVVQVEKLKKKNSNLKVKLGQWMDPQFVSDESLQHRLEMISLTGARWAELAITYDNAIKFESTKSPEMVFQARVTILKAWESWLRYAPLDVLDELLKMINERVATSGDELIDQSALVTIDVYSPPTY